MRTPCGKCTICGTLTVDYTITYAIVEQRKQYPFANRRKTIIATLCPSCLNIILGKKLVDVVTNG